MNDDELRARLGRLDPQATAPVDPITSPRAQDLLERTMSTTPAITPSPTAPMTEQQPPRRRALALTVAAGVAAIGLAAGLLAAQGDDKPTRTQAKKSTLALTVPGGSSLQSCIRFDVEILKGFPVAFAGTVTSVDAGTATLDVTKWYKGGTADVVTVATPATNTSVSIGSVQFMAGKDYLVTANDGVVTSCGFTGEADDTLRQAFTDAFGG